jgi:hypothetical protein
LEKKTARQNLKQRIKRNTKKRLKVKAVTLLKKREIVTTPSTQMIHAKV